VPGSQKNTLTLFFQYDINRQEVLSSSDNCCTVLGASLTALRRNGALFLAYIHPEDRYRVSSILEQSLKGSAPCITTYRWIRPDCQSVRIIHLRAECEATTGLLNGFICDVTSDAYRFRYDGDCAVNLGEFLRHTQTSGLVLDLDFTIRSMHWEKRGLDRTGYLEEREHESFRVGRSFPECINSEETRHILRQDLQRALEEPTESRVLEWDLYRIKITPITEQGIPHALLVSFEERTKELELEKELRALNEQLDTLAAADPIAMELINTCQRVLGYAALIQRHAPPHSMTKAALEALTASSRELGHRVQELHGIFQRNSAVDMEPAPHQDPLAEYRASSHTSPARILFASEAPRTMSPLSIAMNDAGLPSTMCTLDEAIIREQIINHPQLRIIVLDIPRRELGHVSLIRTLRRLFPALHIVTLVPGATTTYPELQRAGALLSLSKPLAPRELERVLRGLITFVASLKTL
jgi:PAS domain-containing protein